MIRLFVVDFFIDIEFFRFRRFILILTFTKTLIFFNKTLHFLDVKLFFLSGGISIGYLFKVEIFIIEIKKVIASLIIESLVDIGTALKIKEILFIEGINTSISSIIKGLIDIKITLKIEEVLFIEATIIISNFLKVFFKYAKILF